MSNRKEYIDKLSDQLKKWDNEIEKLEMKANQAKTGAKSDYQQHLEKLRSKREEAGNKIKEIREASDEAWQELKIGTEVAFETMKNAMDNAVSKFK